jgi:CheY-like chemotaxis protein
VDPVRQRGEEVAQAVKEAGFDAVVVQTGRQALQRLGESGDIDVMLIDYQVFDPLLNDLLAQLRADVNVGQIPIIVTIPPTPDGVRQPELVLRLQRLASNYRLVSTMPATLDPEVLKKELTVRVEQAMGKPLTEAERKAMTGEALVWLKRLATGETPGYSVRAAEDVILKALRSDELGGLAVEAAGRLPGRRAQRELADMVLDDAIRPEIRLLAAQELNRNIQQNGPVLPKEGVVALNELAQKAADQRLRTAVAQVMGSMRPGATRTGLRLQQYQPAPAGEAPPPKEEKEK